MENNDYQGRVSLFITYQWQIDAVRQDDCIILDKVFDTLDEAYEEMEKVIPENYYPDDGDDFHQWNDLIIAGDPDIFLQYASIVDDNHNFLAALRPI